MDSSLQKHDTSSNSERRRAAGSATDSPKPCRCRCVKSAPIGHRQSAACPSGSSRIVASAAADVGRHRSCFGRSGENVRSAPAKSGLGRSLPLNTHDTGPTSNDLGPKPHRRDHAMRVRPRAPLDSFAARVLPGSSVRHILYADSPAAIFFGFHKSSTSAINLARLYIHTYYVVSSHGPPTRLSLPSLSTGMGLPAVSALSVRVLHRTNPTPRLLELSR